MTLFCAMLHLVEFGPLQICSSIVFSQRKSSNVVTALGSTFLLKRLREKTLTCITTRHLISMQVAATCVPCGCQDYHHLGSSDLPNPPPFTLMIVHMMSQK